MTKADEEGQRKAPILRFKGFTDDWEQRKLKNLITEPLSYGLSVSSKEYDGIHKYLRITDIDEKSRKFNKDKLTSPDIKFNSSSKKYLLSNNDIVFARTGASTGKTYMYQKEDGIVYYAGFLIKASLSSNFDNNFIFQQTYRKRYYQRVKVISQRSGQPGINSKEYGNFDFLITQIEEQNKIGKLFKIFDNLLALYAKKSSCLDSCIAYFIRILYDDPQFFKQKNVQNSIIKSFKLDDILIKNNAKNKDLSILNVESISNKKGFISQKEQFDNYQVASKDLSNYYVIHPKDFAYNPSRINVGSIAYKSPNDVKGIVSPLYVSFKCKNDIVLDKYLWHWFKSTNFEHQRVRLSEGGVRDTLSFNQLSKMKISIPSFEIQRQTINLLEILIQYKEEVDLKLNNLKLIKNTLLQTMFL